jgi:hypothetical protein
MEITPCHLMIIVAVKVGDAANNEVNATVYEAVRQTLLSCTPEIW